MTNPLGQWFTSRRAVAFVALSLLGHQLGCKDSSSEPQTSTETHFLRYCDGDCGSGLTCLCGVCTRACTGTDECTALSSGAQCVSISEAPDAGTTRSCEQGATCDARCVSDNDCKGLGDNYRCNGGYCRSGTVTCPAQRLSPGDEEREIVVAGTTRSYTRHVPTSYAGTSTVPLVLDFHPMSLGLKWEQDNSGFRELSEQEGFIVVWPHGLETSWNVGPCCTSSTTIDDFAFVRAVVRQLTTEACIDPKRVYAVGFSMGASMTYYLACEQAELFAAIATSGMDLLVDSERGCEPTRAVSEISFRSKDDTTAPFAGGPVSLLGSDMTMETCGAVSTFEKWASLNHCTGQPTEADGDGCSTYADCDDHTEVTLCTREQGGQVIGDPQRSWAFLKKHPMP